MIPIIVIVISLILVCFCFYKLGSKKIINKLEQISDECDNNGDRFYDRVFNEFLKKK